MKKLLIIGLLLCVSVGVAGEQGVLIGSDDGVSLYRTIEIPESAIIKSSASSWLFASDWFTPRNLTGIDFIDDCGDSITIFMDITGAPNLVETVVKTVIDSVWRDVETGLYISNDLGYRESITEPKFWTNTHHYLKLRINGEIYRIELIKEEE